MREGRCLAPKVWVERNIVKEGTCLDWMEDPLPEYCRYADEGCALSDSCLNCPFPRCIYDVPGGMLRYDRDKQAREIIFQHGRGLTAKQIVRLLGGNLRSVQRTIREFKRQTSIEVNEDEREVWDE